MHFRTQIKNVTLVNEGRRFVGTLVIDDDRIEEILEGDNDPAVPVDEVIDGTGCYLLPGVIDDHVHFRDPGLTHKGDFFSESKAAAAGGVTTVFDMPNCVPQTTTMRAFEEKWRMGSSTGNMLVEGERALRAIFESSRLPIMTHCEDSALITENLRSLQAAEGSDPCVVHHPEVRSEEACFRSTELAVKLARETGARLHVAHLTTARELELFQPGDRQVTAEACVGHLWFAQDDYQRLGARIKVNPSIKTAADRDALRAALTDGRIYTVGTDHAPHRLSEKVGGCVRAASGMPLVQFSLVAMLELVDKGVLSLERLVQLMCHQPAELFQVENRGYLREGYKADLVMVRPNVPWTLTPNRIQSTCNWSPLEGQTFHWRVERTFCNGFPIYNRGHITDEMFRGQAVCYNR